MFTIIIPTKNRADLLIQNLEYLSSIGVRVLVIDGSSQFNPVASEFPVKYIHAPGLCLNARAKLALDYLNTKYFAFCADDDFICPSGIQKLIQALESDPDLSAVQGRHMQFFSDHYAPGKILPHTYDVFNNLSLANVDACMRLLRVNSFPINFYCYAVCTREVLECFSIIADSVVGTKYSPVAFEPLMGFAVALAGNFKSLNAPHLIRRVSKPWPDPSFEYLLHDKSFSSSRSKLEDLIFFVVNSRHQLVGLKPPSRDLISYTLDQYVESMRMRRHVIPFRRLSTTYMRSSREVINVLCSRLLIKLRLLFGYHGVHKSFFESDEVVYADFLSDSKYIYEFANINKFK